MREVIQLAERVQKALLEGRAVVALESTVITHGLPFPENINTALRLENAVIEEGAMPATIAILDGRIVVGASERELLGLAERDDAAKLNLSNLAAGIASGKPGSTTVAATMLAAHAAGIPVFATGGIGGVHRGVAETMDVSSDIRALATIPVAVVSAGAKAILDLPKTVEALETMGVPIYGWRTDEFPAFYRRESGMPVDARFDKLSQLGKAIRTHWGLGLTSGVLVANPVPEGMELAKDVYEKALAESLAEAEKQGLRGRAVTPFLLEAMRRASEGQSVFTNTALLENNVRLAAQVAGELCGA